MRLFSWASFSPDFGGSSPQGVERLARQFGSPHIDPTHLALWAVDEAGEELIETMKAAGVNRARLRGRLVEAVPRGKAEAGEAPVVRRLPWSSRAEQVWARGRALASSPDRVGSREVLLALLRTAIPPALLLREEGLTEDRLMPGPEA
jgi:ATP-dependent Clp protease ATP-binding subunit ClpA